MIFNVFVLLNIDPSNIQTESVDNGNFVHVQVKNVQCLLTQSVHLALCLLMCEIEYLFDQKTNRMAEVTLASFNVMVLGEYILTLTNNIMIF